MLKYSTGLRMLRRTFDSVTGNLTPPTTCTRKWGPCSCPVLLVTIRTTGQQVLLANQQNNRNKEVKRRIYFNNLAESAIPMAARYQSFEAQSGSSEDSELDDDIWGERYDLL